tara:strand:+ start:639 stop:959 length:321 start_codon:yes stop_codon:yes gene_type:complete
MSSKELVKVSSGYYTKYYFNSVKDACAFVTALEERRVRYVPTEGGGEFKLDELLWQIERVHHKEPIWLDLGYDVQKQYNSTFSTWVEAGCPLEVSTEEDASEAVAA